MAKIDLIMPKMGESIMEATILKWVKGVGDKVEQDETILEIATDKVDSEIPSPVEGTILEILYQEDSVVEIGKVIAIISTDSEVADVKPSPVIADKPEINKLEKVSEVPFVERLSSPEGLTTSSEKFYSPLVKNIAKQESISISELDAISGSGASGRVTKKDILEYVESRQKGATATTDSISVAQVSIQKQNVEKQQISTPSGGNVEIIEMDRMRRLIADHMVMSKHTSPHVTSFVEADVTNIVNWRNKVKNEFQRKYGEKITFTPLFIDAVVKAIKDYPLVNVSVDGNNIILKKDLNIGMAAALPSGNLIVPVIKNADMLNLVGLTKQVNDLASRARGNKLKPEDIQGGTFTVTNVGTFGNLMGTPIINQPQAAILATGAIKKKPAVLETEHGDVIAIRHMMYLSLSYDHRIVDGSLGGSFLRRIADYLETFDHKQSI